jgi:radical SAM superfamily enzyme
MGKTNSDVLRREFGNVVKKIKRQGGDIGDVDDGLATEGGCIYYGDEEQMKVHCSKCKEKNCF